MIPQLPKRQTKNHQTNGIAKTGSICDSMWTQMQEVLMMKNRIESNIAAGIIESNGSIHVEKNGRFSIGTGTSTAFTDRIILVDTHPTIPIITIRLSLSRSLSPSPSTQTISHHVLAVGVCFLPHRTVPIDFDCDVQPMKVIFA